MTAVSTSARPEPLDGESPAACAYFDELLDAAHRARRAAGAIERTFNVAGRTLRLSFAGGAMVSSITGALAHLTCAEAPADLVVHVWDSASTGVPAPAPRWRPEDHLPRGAIRGFNSARFRTANLPVMDGFSMLDSERRIAVHWDPDAARITLHERSFPLRVILAWWAAQGGLQFAHAGAVGGPKGGVLIAGGSGAGKSTAALACLASGLRLAGDDHVLLGDEPTPVVHGLYCSAKLHWEDVRRLSRLASCVVNRREPGQDKALLLLAGAFADRITARLPLDAILVPRVTGERDSSLAPASRATALAALAPSSMFLLPGDDAAAFRRIARLVRSVPAYELRSGTDLQRLAAAVARLVMEAS
jgi:hypothetical protein